MPSVKSAPQSKGGSDEMLFDRITIEGKSIDLKGANIPIQKVRLDPQNPRLVNTLFGSPQPTSEKDLQSFLAETLWADPNIRDLFRQVQANRGLTERILVTEDNVVIEGNCRTVVYRKLREQDPSEMAWTKIPAWVLPPAIKKREIAILQGEMHVAGKITWASFEKAGHVFRLHNEHLMTQDEIASRLRMSKSKVNQLIRAFETMHVKYLRRYPGAAGVHKFSYFEEFFKNPLLRTAASRDPGLVDRFVDWVGTGKILEGRHVRELPEIIANEQAQKALDRAGYLAALRVLEENNPALTSTLYRALQRATIELRDAGTPDLQEIRNGNQAAIRIVEDLNAALNRFRTIAGLEEK